MYYKTSTLGQAKNHLVCRLLLEKKTYEAGFVNLSMPNNPTLNPAQSTQSFANSCISRFDHRINEVATLPVGQKRALHRIDGNFLKVSQRQAEGFRGGLEFPGHRGVA